MNADQPRASVLMTVFDERPPRIEKAIRSILQQTFRDFEVVLVDDGSTRPDTIACLGRLPAMDSRIRLFRQANGGVPVASNNGLRLARAPLVFRHDSDDWSHPERFARQVAFMDAHPDIAAVGSACQHYRQDGKAFALSQFPGTPDAVRAAFPKSNPFAHGSVCFRRDWVLAIGGYRAQLRNASDYDMFWRLCERWPATNLPEVLYHCLWSENSVTARSFRTRYRNRHIIRILARSRQEGPEMPFSMAVDIAESTARESIGEIRAALGDDLMRAGSYGAALGEYIRGIASWPPRVRPFAKLVRFCVYAVLPALRPHLFRENVRRTRPPTVNG